MRAAAADIALQRLHNLFIRGIRITAEQRNGAHDHPGSAVGALKRTRIQKRLLHGMKRAVFL